jgi:Uma2 family endonuclease
MSSVTANWTEMFQVSIPTMDTELVGEQRRVHVPAGIVDLAGFRAWAHSPDFPDKTRVDYLGGTIWVDLSMEQLYSHNQVKVEVYRVLIALVRASRSGRFIADRMRFSYPGADASVEPDGAYVSFDALSNGRVLQIPGREGGVLELEGAPEMVMEVLSDSSEGKDSELLPAYYAAAGVSEFWRIDARTELRFEILRLADDNFIPSEQADGWWRSDAFDKSFRLVAGADRLGQPEYTLESRP